MKQIIACIPARYQASRFPGKLLATLGDRPVIAHVVQRVQRARSVGEVIVATDDERIADAVRGLGATVKMTSQYHQSGTDRVAEAVRDIPCGIVVNVQGDEPFIEPESIDRAVHPLIVDPNCQLSTLVRPLRDPCELCDSSVVKVVRDADDWALYFSRSPIPFFRDLYPEPGCGLPQSVPDGVWAHIGLYVYRKRTLLELVNWGPCDLEKAEKLEQLRALYHGLRIRTVPVQGATIGIDTPDDLKRAEDILAAGD
ncbi:MAG: 3-deoxy-manno-octulosonate cytidylyltransferase [Candidatus Alcyoniella australis]|nr:3-deoxy-manno-octulosonate cytidylyltransferase [Candidatus Alcyoniella australis]